MSFIDILRGKKKVTHNLILYVQFKHTRGDENDSERKRLPKTKESNRTLWARERSLADK